MTCVEYRRWLSPYVDEQLAARERGELEAHLQGCGACRDELAALTRMLTSLREMEPVQGPDLLPGIRRRLAEEPWWRLLIHRVTAPWPQSLPVHGLALAVCGLIAFVVVTLPRVRSVKGLLAQGSYEPAVVPQERFRQMAQEGDEQERIAVGKRSVSQLERFQTPSKLEAPIAGGAVVAAPGTLAYNEPAASDAVMMDKRAVLRDTNATDEKGRLGIAGGGVRRELSATAKIAANVTEAVGEALRPIEISPNDQACHVDADCTVMVTRCDGCECGVVVNRTAASGYAARHAQLCQGYRGVMCDYVCPPTREECVDGRCVQVPIQ